MPFMALSFNNIPLSRSAWFDPTQAHSGLLARQAFDVSGPGPIHPPEDLEPATAQDICSRLCCGSQAASSAGAITRGVMPGPSRRMPVHAPPPRCGSSAAGERCGFFTFCGIFSKIVLLDAWTKVALVFKPIEMHLVPTKGNVWPARATKIPNAPRT
jgi:hypothetical protein